MTPIELTDNQIDVMGRPCFACARAAHVLIAAGVYAKGPKKAEYEQAVYIHWAMDMLDKHGDDWLDAANKALKELHESIPKTDTEH